MKHTKTPSYQKTQDDTKSQPYVKITTVKLLAQLLRDAHFVDEDVAIEVLSTLMQKVTHIDIRSAIVASLLSMLSTVQRDLAEKILKSLEVVIPLAGGLNERSPLTDSDWEAMLDSPDDQKLPAFFAESPMLTQQLEFKGTTGQPFVYMQEYVDRSFFLLWDTCRKRRDAGYDCVSHLFLLHQP